MKNGSVFTDINGAPLHAHGGYIIRYGEYWYWYGEDRRENYYVSCYRSPDLKSWEFRNHILTTDSVKRPYRVRTELRLCRDDGHKVNIERPKVLYCEKTNKFVMWAHYENGRDYHDAACCVATCDAPDGDFIYHGHFNPYGYMSRDCTLFRDNDGVAYFISSSRDNADMHVYRLTDDYMNVDGLVNVLWQGEFREAPAVFYRDGRYYMLSSFCTGWRPNQGCYASADKIDGRWSMLSPFGDSTTYHSQPAFVLPVDGEYYYFGDRWGGHPMSHPFDYSKSGYVILKIRFRGDGSPYIEWNDEAFM